MIIDEFPLTRNQSFLPVRVSGHEVGLLAAVAQICSTCTATGTGTVDLRSALTHVVQAKLLPVFSHRYPAKRLLHRIETLDALHAERVALAGSHVKRIEKNTLCSAT
jgi:hypothetical protein